MSPNGKLRPTGAVAFSAAALLIAGCGGGGTKSSSGTASSGGASGTSSAPAPASGPGGTLHLNADPSGALKFNVKSLSAKPGKVTLVMKNPSQLSHSIAIQGNGVTAAGQVVGPNGTSTVTASLKPGTYTFYCTVPGHREAGMFGTLTVK
jgi:uncharacterized cupredoxin-like copper-binding protein